jgi:hypothetical protein
VANAIEAHVALFIGVGFSDDRRLEVLVLLVFFVLIIMIMVRFLWSAACALK